MWCRFRLGTPSRIQGAGNIVSKYVILQLSTCIRIPFKHLSKSDSHQYTLLYPTFETSASTDREKVAAHLLKTGDAVDANHLLLEAYKDLYAFYGNLVRVVRLGIPITGVGVIDFSLNTNMQ